MDFVVFRERERQAGMSPSRYRLEGKGLSRVEKKSPVSLGPWMAPVVAVV